MVVTDDSQYGQREKISSNDDQFGATDHTSGGNSESGTQDNGYVIRVDTGELIDTAVKSVAGGLATGLVLNGVFRKK